MKKLIAVLLALSALTVSAFAAGSPEPASGEVPAAAREETAEITAALSEEEAVAAALKDAGFAEEDVTVTRTRLREKEDENGTAIAVYTVKFHTADTTYKYHVDANTGVILDVTVTEGVSEGHGRGSRGGASGEPDEAEAGAESKASGEPKSSAEPETEDEAAADNGAETGDETAAASGRSGHSGRSGGRRASSGEPDAAGGATETAGA